MSGFRHSIVDDNTLESILVVVVFMAGILVDAFASIGKDIE